MCRHEKMSKKDDPLLPIVHSCSPCHVHYFQLTPIRRDLLRLKPPPPSLPLDPPSQAQPLFQSVQSRGTHTCMATSPSFPQRRPTLPLMTVFTPPTILSSTRDGLRLSTTPVSDVDTRVRWVSIPGVVVCLLCRGSAGGTRSGRFKMGKLDHTMVDVCRHGILLHANRRQSQ
jgi:hypothetical protein